MESIDTSRIEYSLRGIERQLKNLVFVQSLILEKSTGTIIREDGWRILHNIQRETVSEFGEE